MCGDEWSLERYDQGANVGTLEEENGAGLKKEDAEPRPAGRGEQARLAEPDQGAEIQR